MGKVELKAINVISIILVFLIGISCSSVRKNKTKSDRLEIERFKSTNTSLTFETFEFENNERIPAFVEINGIYVNSKFKKPFVPIYIAVTKGNYNVEIHFLGKKSIKLKKLYLKKGDSISVKSFMKDDLTVLN